MRCEPAWLRSMEEAPRSESREVSPHELVAACLEWITEVNPDLNAFTVKDWIDAVGVRCTGGASCDVTITAVRGGTTHLESDRLSDDVVERARGWSPPQHR